MKILVSCCYVNAISVIGLEQKGQAWLSKTTSQNKAVISTATEVFAGEKGRLRPKIVQAIRYVKNIFERQ
jgi:hypothetical protein